MAESQSSLVNLGGRLLSRCFRSFLKFLGLALPLFFGLLGLGARFGRRALVRGFFLGCPRVCLKMTLEILHGLSTSAMGGGTPAYKAPEQYSEEDFGKVGMPFIYKTRTITLPT